MSLFAGCCEICGFEPEYKDDLVIREMPVVGSTHSLHFKMCRLCSDFDMHQNLRERMMLIVIRGINEILKRLDGRTTK